MICTNLFKLWIGLHEKHLIAMIVLNNDYNKFFNKLYKFSTVLF